MERYKRQIQLPQVGENGQQKLINTKVLVVGAGGLGCAILPYLVASGIGTIGIVDGDRIDESNLQRQILYSEKSTSLLKVDVAKKHLEQLNSSAKINTYSQYLNGTNALDIFEDYDVVVDATDNLSTRYLINDACVLLNKPFVYGSIYKFEGQVSVFNYKNGPTYRCLFDKTKNQVPNCEISGVLGTTVGCIGMLQANEVLKIILQTGEILSGVLLIYDTLTNSQHKIRFEKNKAIQVDGAFFSAEHGQDKTAIITFEEALRKNLTFIDVREYNELPKMDFPKTIQLPLSILETAFDSLDKNVDYAVFCQSGKRSLQAIKQLNAHQFNKLFNIDGGVNTIIKNRTNEKRIY